MKLGPFYIEDYVLVFLLIVVVWRMFMSVADFIDPLGYTSRKIERLKTRVEYNTNQFYFLLAGKKKSMHRICSIVVLGIEAIVAYGILKALFII